MKSDSKLRALVLEHTREARWSLALAGLCLAGHTAAELLSPWPLKLIFDHVLLPKASHAAPHLLAPVLSSGRATSLIVLSAGILILACLRGLFAYGQLFLTSRAGYQLVYRLRRELFLHVQNLSLSFHTRSRSGEVLTKITSDTNALRDVFTDAALTMAGHLVTVVGMFVVLFFLDWRLSLIVLAVFPLLCFSLFKVYRRVRVSARSQREREGRVASRITEVLGSVSLVQAFARSGYEQEKFDTESSQTLEQSVRMARMEAAAARGTEIISALAIFAAVCFGGFAVLEGRMTPGGLLVFTAYLTSMYKPLRGLAKISSQFSKALVSAERIEEIFRIAPEPPDSPSAVRASGLRGEIAFENVYFDYGAGQGVLQNLSFHIPAGERVALVGSSGAGKSTVASLILRLYDPLSGVIRVDGRDLRSYERESLRREIGIVLQDSILFGASIRENIAYGKPEASLEEIEQAARHAHAHGFVEALPKGYDTVVGERGCTLSGGQRQRLCLARAIIRQPSVLILDEPTSAVDAESAELIQAAVDRLQRGKTLLFIAHQFSGMERFDRILVMRNGQLVEQGTHAALIEQKGFYFELLRAQGLAELEEVAL